MHYEYGLISFSYPVFLVYGLFFVYEIKFV